MSKVILKNYEEINKIVLDSSEEIHSLIKAKLEHIDSGQAWLIKGRIASYVFRLHHDEAQFLNQKLEKEILELTNRDSQ